MRTHNTNEINSTRGYGETKCDRKLKRSSFTVPEVVAQIFYHRYAQIYIVILDLWCYAIASQIYIVILDHGSAML